MSDFHSKKESMNENLEHYGYRNAKREQIEAWFDNHPEPWNIDMSTFEENGKLIQIFFCDTYHDNFLIKIKCNNAQLALTLSKKLYFTTSQMGIEQILINRELFLLRTRFFEC